MKQNESKNSVYTNSMVVILHLVTKISTKSKNIRTNDKILLIMWNTPLTLSVFDPLVKGDYVSGLGPSSLPRGSK